MASDALILAALSNDPLGDFDRQLTFDINHTAAINTARMSKKAGVKKLIFMLKSNYKKTKFSI